MESEIYFDWHVEKLNDNFVFRKVNKLDVIGEDDFSNAIKLINNKVYLVLHDSSPSKIILCDSMEDFNRKVEYYNEEEKDRRFDEFSKNYKEDDNYEHLVSIKSVAKVIGGKRIKPNYMSSPLYNITKAWKDGFITDVEYNRILEDE